MGRGAFGFGLKALGWAARNSAASRTTNKPQDRDMTFLPVRVCVRSIHPPVRRSRDESTRIVRSGAKKGKQRLRSGPLSFACVVRSAKAARTANCVGAEFLADGVCRPVQSSLLGAPLLVEEMPFGWRAKREPGRSHPQKPQWQPFLRNTPLEPLTGGLPDRLGQVGGL